MTVRSRLWLGLILLPIALALGFSTVIVLTGRSVPVRTGHVMTAAVPLLHYRRIP